METFIFATYILSLIAFVIAMYSIVEVRELRSQLRRRQAEARKQTVQQNKKTSKGLWN